MEIIKHKLPIYRPGGSTMGTDPEVFLKRGNKTVSSDAVVPLEGMLPRQYYTMKNGKTVLVTAPSVVRDGIQVELHPVPFSCRETGWGTIMAAYEALKAAAHRADLSIDWRAVIEIPPDNFEELPDEAKVLGCTPSLSIHREDCHLPVTDDYPTRSAGGHIHLSTKHDPVLVVRLMDIIVGNTCVLLDRDPLAKTRRLVYGRAGEYRVPSYGVEYRTLSNFWLRAYPLMSGVFAMARSCQSIVNSGAHAWFLDNFDPLEVARAIDENDETLARQHFDRVIKIIEGFGWQDQALALGPWMLNRFDKLCKDGINKRYPIERAPVGGVYTGGWEKTMGGF